MQIFDCKNNIQKKGIRYILFRICYRIFIWFTPLIGFDVASDYRSLLNLVWQSKLDLLHVILGRKQDKG